MWRCSHAYVVHTSTSVCVCKHLHTYTHLSTYTLTTHPQALHSRATWKNKRKHQLKPLVVKRTTQRKMTAKGKNKNKMQKGEGSGFTPHTYTYSHTRDYSPTCTHRRVTQHIYVEMLTCLYCAH
ncbi:hypothetical protein D1007_51987 [Hordeum vulgare]|nr:hypothetical protein D1007_51987 [Hordeum vulgare]